MNQKTLVALVVGNTIVSMIAALYAYKMSCVIEKVLDASLEHIEALEQVITDIQFHNITKNLDDY